MDIQGSHSNIINDSTIVHPHAVALTNAPHYPPSTSSLPPTPLPNPSSGPTSSTVIVAASSVPATMSSSSHPSEAFASSSTHLPVQVQYVPDYPPSDPYAQHSLPQSPAVTFPQHNTHAHVHHLPHHQAPFYQYNIEPTPSSFSSPTNSSPSASPYHPDHLRRPTSAFPLFLAQHNPAAPAHIDSFDHRTAVGAPPLPPAAPYNRFSTPPSMSMETPSSSVAYMSSPPFNQNYVQSTYTFAHVEGTVEDMQRRQLPMLTPPYPHQTKFAHGHDMPSYGYSVVVDGTDAYGGVGDVSRSGSSVNPHHTHQEPVWPMKTGPRLVLANGTPSDMVPMTASVPAVDPTPAHPGHGYDNVSHATHSPVVHTFVGTQSMVANSDSAHSTSANCTASALSSSYGSGPDALHSTREGYINATNMEGYLVQGPIPSQGCSFTAQHFDGPHPPTLPTTAQPSQSHPEQPIRLSGPQTHVQNTATTNVPTIDDSTSSAPRGGSNAGQSYDPAYGTNPSANVENGLSKENTGYSVSEASESSTLVQNSAPKDDVNPCNRGEAADNTKEEEQRPPENSNSTSNTSRTVEVAPIPHVPADSSVHASLGSGNGELGSRFKQVAVASLPYTTELGAKMSERLDTNMDQRANILGTVDSNRTDESSNTVMATIKPSPTGESAQPQHSSPLQQDSVPESSQAPGSSKVVEEVSTASLSDPVVASTSRSHHTDIDRSYSLSLQTTSFPESTADMQAISSPSFHHGPDSHGYPFSSTLPYGSHASSWASSNFNPHLPAMPSHLRSEWRRSSYPVHGSLSQPKEYERLPVHPIGRQTSLHVDTPGSISPRPAYTVHRNSLPNLPSSADLPPLPGSGSARPSPPLASGYYTPSGRLVPAAFGNASSSHGSVSSVGSTPPAVLQDVSTSSMSMYSRFDPSASTQPTQQASAIFDSPQDQSSTPYEQQYPPFPASSTASTQPNYGQSIQYHTYPHEFRYGAGGPSHTRPYHQRDSSTSPAPPMIAGTKRTREDEWLGDTSEMDRTSPRRRLSYSQSGPMVPGPMHFKSSMSPSLPPAEMGVIRVNSYAPSLKDMGIRDVVGDPLPALADRYSNVHRRASDVSIQNAAETNYSFIALPGNTVRKRPRRKFEEITRNYICNWPGCTKAYGTLNHLNAHVTMQKHGPKRVPAEFKELRKVWRRQKREQQQQQAMQRAAGDLFLDANDQDDDGEDDDPALYEGM